MDFPFESVCSLSLVCCMVLEGNELLGAAEIDTPVTWMTEVRHENITYLVIYCPCLLFFG